MYVQVFYLYWNKKRSDRIPERLIKHVILEPKLLIMAFPGELDVTICNLMVISRFSVHISLWFL